MLNFLLPGVISTYWKWNKAEFNKIKKNSFEKPLVMVCYSRYCPHCDGLEQGTREYAEGYGNRSDSYVSMIDCAVSPDCSLFHISGTPTITLVMGSNDKYWVRIPSRDGHVWNEYLDIYLSSNIREIFSDEELYNATLEPTNGGTTFYLETPSKKDPIFLELSKLSKKYRLFNDSFVYKINPSISKSILRSFRSPYSYQTYDNFLKMKIHRKLYDSHGKPYSQLEQFLDFYKFGYRHIYTNEEYKEMIKYSPMMTFVTESNSLSTYQTNIFQIINRNYSHIAFGFLPITESKGIIEKSISSNNHLFLLYDDKSHNCRFITFSRISSLLNSPLLQLIKTKEICGTYYDPVSNFSEPFFTTKSGITGKNFQFFLYIISFIIIGIFRFCSDFNNKEQ